MELKPIRFSSGGKKDVTQILASSDPSLSMTALLQNATAPPAEGMKSLLLQELRIQYTAKIWNAPHKKEGTKTFFVMRALQLLALLLSLTAFSQSRDARISLSITSGPLEQALKEIKNQSGYEFVYTREQIKRSIPVTIHFESELLDKALDVCFKEQPFTYVIEGKYIALRDRSENIAQVPLQKEISGVIVDEKDDALSNITVTVKSTGNATITDSRGYFLLKNIRENDVLIISAIGYQTRQIDVKRRNYFDIRLSIAVNEMDETLVIAYGTTTRRLNTGNVSKVSSKEIEMQPVGNVLAALEGRVPGMVVTQTSGVPGSSFNVEIRGRTSLDLSLSRNDPLFIVDGVPYEAGNLPVNQVTSAANNPKSISQGGLSPLSFINPSDIESIEVLKDADATAIYGSRGANGVILITTKKGTAGVTRLNINAYTGANKITRTMNMLTTPQYVQMRREAFGNDGIHCCQCTGYFALGQHPIY